MHRVIPRRTLLGAAALAALPSSPRAQALPGRPIRLVVSFAAGGISDLLARSLTDRAAQRLGQAVVVENRAGANGNVAAEHVARAPADGTAVLVATVATLSVNPLIYPQLPFDPDRDFAPLLAIGETPHVLVASPALLPAARGLPDLLAAARARPGEVSFGTTGPGGTPHLTQLLLQSLTGTRFSDIAFRSGAASVQAVLGGHVACTSEALPIVIEHIRAGTLRALAVAAPRRLAALPEVPATAELDLAALVNGNVTAMLLRSGTPSAALSALHAAFAEAIAAPETAARFAAQGTLPLGGPPAELAALVGAWRDRWRPLVTGIRPA